jgi:hypothetical protein
MLQNQITVSTDVTVETIAAAPRADVAAYAIDWRNDREWIGALSDVRLVTEPPFGVGSRVARVASFRGKRMEYVNEVIELEPERRLVMRSVRSPFPMTVTYEFADAAGGTSIRIRAQGDVSGFYKLGGPLLSRAVRRSIEKDLARLKATVESRSTDHPT